MTVSMWRTAVVIGLAMLMAGCSNYTSTYKPPNDGRGRGIWVKNKLQLVMPPSLPRCNHPIPGEIQRQFTHWVPRDRYGYYVPPRRRRGGPTIVIIGVHTHHHVHGPHLPLLPIPGGKMDGDGAKAFLVVVAVGAIIAFPFIAMGLAMGHPEPAEDVIAAIDKLNRYNDESRRIIGLCYATLPGGGQ